MSAIHVRSPRTLPIVTDAPPALFNSASVRGPEPIGPGGGAPGAIAAGGALAGEPAAAVLICAISRLTLLACRKRSLARAEAYSSSLSEDGGVIGTAEPGASGVPAPLISSITGAWCALAAGDFFPLAALAFAASSACCSAARRSSISALCRVSSAVRFLLSVSFCAFLSEFVDSDALPDG